MVLAFTLLFPAVKLAGIKSAADVGWPRDPHRRKRLSTWFAVGVLSIGAAYLLSAAAGALYFRPRSTDLWVVSSKWMGLLAGAWLIGCIEEALFRGFIFSTLRKRNSLLFSTLLASLYFSGVHFLRPVEPPHLTPTDWDAGLRLLAHVTDGVQRQYAAPMFANLFLMGVVLCLLFERDRSVHAVAGLHAGWVWMQGVGTFLFDRQIGRWQFLFGNSETLSMTWVGTLILIVFCTFAWFRLRAPSRIPDGTP